MKKWKDECHNLIHGQHLLNERSDIVVSVVAAAVVAAVVDVANIADIVEIVNIADGCSRPVVAAQGVQVAQAVQLG